MDVFGTVTAAIGVLDQTRQLVTKIYQRYQLMKEVPEKCDRLAKGLDEMEKILHELQRYKAGTVPEMGMRLMNAISGYVENTRKALEAEVSKRESLLRVKRIFRARKISEALDERIDRLEQMELRGLILGFAAHQVETSLAPVDLSKDRFIAQYNVPSTPEGLVLNLDDHTTFEGRLKQRLLSDDVNTVGAVGGRQVAAAQGMSGVGKTCAVTAVGNDEEVQRYYSGGVYFFSFGQNADDGDIIQQLADKVETSGGYQLATSMRSESALNSVVEKGQGWFKDRRCLFICDDVWRREDQSGGYLHLMRRLCNGKGGGCVLLSTRDHQVAEAVNESNCVEFGKRNESAAGIILCRHAGAKPGWISSVLETGHGSWQYVLKRCGGLPIALAVAGKAIARISKQMKVGAGPEARITNASIEYKNRLEQSLAYLGKRAGDEHEGLFSALQTSLEFATQVANKSGKDDTMSMEELHRGLCVLQKKGWAPVTMLSCLWGIDEREAGTVVEAMGEMSVCDVEYRTVEGKSIIGVKMHDLIHDYCKIQAEAEDDKGARRWHNKVIEGYKQRYLEDSSCVGDVEWWSEKVVNDSYIHTNLARHLVEVGKGNTLKRLVLDYRWTKRQLKLSQHVGLESDFRQAARCGMRADEVDVIVKSLRDSWSRIDIDALGFDFRELSFQLLGCLPDVKDVMMEVKKYRASVEKWTRKPYLVPVAGSVGKMDESLQQIYVGSGVMSAAVLPDLKRAVVGLAFGELWMVNLDSKEVEKEFVGHPGRACSVAVSRDGLKMVSGSWDNTVRRWDVEKGSSIGAPLLGHKAQVVSVGVSEDGEVIASGDLNGTIRVWKMRTGEVIRELIGGHGNPVWSVAVDKDGTRVISGSDNRIVRVWNVLSGKTVVGPLHGHDLRVTSVALSGNNRYIVSASDSIRIWDASNGKLVRVLRCDPSTWTISVAVSEDCQTVVAGCSDGLVRVWKISEENKGEAVLRGHNDWVKCVALSHDGRRVISGSPDKTVRVWDISSMTIEGCDSAVNAKEEKKIYKLSVSIDGQLVATAHESGTITIHNAQTGRLNSAMLGNPYSKVTSITISNGNRYVVSGSTDNTIQIWDATTGMQVGDPLHGHNGCVRTVAIGSECRWLVSGSDDKTLRRWELPSGKPIGQPFVGHAWSVTCVVICSDDQLVVSGSADGTVRMWDSSSGKTVGSPLRHDEGVASVAVSRDKQQIISMDRGDKVYCWDIATGEALKCAAENESTWMHLHCMMRNGWVAKGERDGKGVWTKPHAVAHGDGVYFSESAHGQGFAKVGDFGSEVKNLAVDATGTVWALVGWDRTGVLGGAGLVKAILVED